MFEPYSSANFDEIERDYDHEDVNRYCKMAFGKQISKQEWVAAMNKTLLQPQYSIAPGYILPPFTGIKPSLTGKAFIFCDFILAGPTPKIKRPSNSDFHNFFGPKIPDRLHLGVRVPKQYIKKGHQIWGYGSFSFGVESKRKKEAYVSFIRVRPDLQQSGIGSKLMVAYENMCRSLGFKTVTLSAVNLGQYFWAVSGYDFYDTEEKEKIRQTVHKFIDSLLPVTQRAKAHAAADKLDAAAEFARFAPGGVETAIEIEHQVLKVGAGKFALLMTGSGWRAIKNL